MVRNKPLDNAINSKSVFHHYVYFRKLFDLNFIYNKFIYVDDIMVNCKSMTIINMFEFQLSDELEIKDPRAQFKWEN